MALPERTLSLIRIIYDDPFYKRTYPDVAAAFIGRSAIDHFINEGIYENRTPNAVIDPNYLLTTNDDLQRAYNDRLNKYNGNVGAAEREFNVVWHFLTEGAW